MTLELKSTFGNIHLPITETYKQHPNPEPPSESNRYTPSHQTAPTTADSTGTKAIFNCTPAWNTAVYQFACEQKTLKHTDGRDGERFRCNLPVHFGPDTGTDEQTHRLTPCRFAVCHNILSTSAHQRQRQLQHCSPVWGGSVGRRLRNMRPPIRIKCPLLHCARPPVRYRNVRHSPFTLFCRRGRLRLVACRPVTFCGRSNRKQKPVAVVWPRRRLNWRFCVGGCWVCWSKSNRYIDVWFKMFFMHN